jgi:biopolymer transport protein ExbD
VNIDSGSTIYIDGNPVRPWMVQSRVRDYLDSTGGGSVLVVADRHVPAERLIEVVDQCRLAGAANVGVATDKEAG